MDGFDSNIYAGFTTLAEARIYLIDYGIHHPRIYDVIEQCGDVEDINTNTSDSRLDAQVETLLPEVEQRNSVIICQPRSPSVTSLDGSMSVMNQVTDPDTWDESTHVKRRIQSEFVEDMKVVSSDSGESQSPNTVAHNTRSTITKMAAVVNKLDNTSDNLCTDDLGNSALNDVDEDVTLVKQRLNIPNTQRKSATHLGSIQESEDTMRIVGSPPKHFGDWCSHTSGS